MSILIKGINRPTCCAGCPFESINPYSGDLFCVILAEPTNGVRETSRLDDCYIAPATPHGRLVDADVLCERLMTAWNIADSEGRHIIGKVIADVVVPIVVSTPTFIEAEVKENA